MIKDPGKTRTRIIEAAAALFYGDGIRAVSVDAVAEKAGVTKRTLYYHFESKDQLVAAYLEARDQPAQKTFARWFHEAEGDLAAKIQALFSRLAISAKHPKWKGCGFLRTVAELVGTPGHPAIKVGASHKIGVESWLAGVLREGGIEGAETLARQICVLIDGAFSITLVHRNPLYIEAAGLAAAALVQTHRQHADAR